LKGKGKKEIERELHGANNFRLALGYIRLLISNNGRIKFPLHENPRNPDKQYFQQKDLGHTEEARRKSARLSAI